MLCISFFQATRRKKCFMNLIYFFLSYEVKAAQKAKNKPCSADILLWPHPEHCSTLTVVHLSRTSETSRWASKNVLFLAP